MGIMGAGKDTRSEMQWNKYDPPQSLADWRMCAEQGFTHDGLKAVGLGSTVEAKDEVEKARKNAGLKPYSPRTINNESESNKE
jgi:hypothetical protein